jgi:hypothetical protein
MTWLQKAASEMFTLGPYLFDIDKATQLVSGKTPIQFSPEETKKVGSLRGLAYIDPEAAMISERNDPVILATICFEPKKMNSILIDGYHRVHKAIQLGQGIQGYLLSFDETLQLMDRDRQHMMMSQYVQAPEWATRDMVLKLYKKQKSRL